MGVSKAADQSATSVVSVRTTPGVRRLRRCAGRCGGGGRGSRGAGRRAEEGDPRGQSDADGEARSRRGAQDGSDGKREGPSEIFGAARGRARKQRAYARLGAGGRSSAPSRFTSVKGGPVGPRRANVTMRRLTAGGDVSADTRGGRRAVQSAFGRRATMRSPPRLLGVRHSHPGGPSPETRRPYGVVTSSSRATYRRARRRACSARRAGDEDLPRLVRQLLRPLLALPRIA